MKDFFAISDERRKTFNGDWSRSPERINIMNGPIVENLNNINPSLDISVEKTNAYKYSYTKKHDIVIKINGIIKKVLETKFIEKDFEKNTNNYLEGEVGRSVIVEHNGIEYYSLVCIRSSATKGNFQKTKKHCEAYKYLKNVCVLYYNDETKEYTLLVGDDYDTFLNKIANGVNE